MHKGAVGDYIITCCNIFRCISDAFSLCLLCKVSADADGYVVLDQGDNLALLWQGQARETCHNHPLSMSRLWLNEKASTHMRRASHSFRNGLNCLKMTPIPAYVICFARRCALRAPTIVNLSSVSRARVSSASDLREMSVAMMSALSALTTGGDSPCTQDQSPSVHPFTYI